MSQKSFKSDVEALQREIDLLNSQITKSENCLPTILISGICIPILVFIVLFFFQPRFVKAKEGDRYTRSKSRLFFWTVFITLVSWACMYGFSYFTGYGGESMICRRA